MGKCSTLHGEGGLGNGHFPSGLSLCGKNSRETGGELVPHDQLTEIHDILIRSEGGSAIIGVECSQALKGRDEQEAQPYRSWRVQPKKEVRRRCMTQMSTLAQSIR